MKHRKLLLVVLAVVLIYGAAAFASYAKFHVVNPISAAAGLTQILLTEKEYMEIQDDPKVILAQPDASLDDYMEEQGMTRADDEQMGAISVFHNGDYREYVQYSVNGYFSRWSWINK